MEQLTICIPTYNRKERLLHQLDSLYKQHSIYDVNILIIDNASNYNVKEAIIDHFGEENVNNLTVHVNRTNLGLEANICMPFLLAKTKWIWTLGDDDKTLEGSLDIILSDINEHPNYAGFIYSINGMSPHKNISHFELGGFIQYLNDESIHPGDLFFLSTKVFNLEMLLPFVGNAFRECINCVGHLVPFFYCLDKKCGIIATRDKAIVQYLPPQKGTGYKRDRIAYEFSLISYMELNIDHAHWKLLCKYIGSDFYINGLISDYLQYKPRYKGRFLFHEVYRRILRPIGPQMAVYYIVFELSYIVNKDLSRFFARIRHPF